MYSNLIKAIENSRYAHSEIAGYLSIGEERLKRKLYGKEDIVLSEAYILMKIFNCYSFDYLFKREE